jgi:outer membrane protein
MSKADGQVGISTRSNQEPVRINSVSSPQTTLSHTGAVAAISVFSALISAFPWSVAFAQDTAATTQPPASAPSSLSGSIFGGAISVPEYEGSADIAVLPLIVGELRWGDNRYAAWDGLAGRINVLNSDRFEFGPAINITMGRDKDIESLRIRRLGEIDTAVELGAFAAYSIPGGFRDGDMARFTGQITSDVSDAHQGVLGDLTASYRTRFGEKLGVMASTSVSFSNDKFADTFFSVTQAGALATGLKATTVEAGIMDFSVGVTATYDLNDRLSFFATTKYSRLLGDFANSPIVALEGDDNQFSVGLGIGRKF